VLADFGPLTGSVQGTVAVRLPGGAHALPEVVRALDASSIRVDRLELADPSLDEVFLDVTGRIPEGA
jgi:hypothetical protein